MDHQWQATATKTGSKNKIRSKRPRDSWQIWEVRRRARSHHWGGGGGGARTRRCARWFQRGRACIHPGGQLLGPPLCKLLCNCVDGVTRDQNIHTRVSLPPSVTSVGFWHQGDGKRYAFWVLYACQRGRALGWRNTSKRAVIPLLTSFLSCCDAPAFTRPHMQRLHTLEDFIISLMHPRRSIVHFN